MSFMFVSVLEKVESLQEQLDAYNAGEKPVTDTLDIPDGAVKPKRCRYTQSELHVQWVGMLISRIFHSFGPFLGQMLANNVVHEEKISGMTGCSKLTMLLVNRYYFFT